MFFLSLLGQIIAYRRRIAPDVKKTRLSIKFKYSCLNVLFKKVQLIGKNGFDVVRMTDQRLQRKKNLFNSRRESFLEMQEG